MEISPLFVLLVVWWLFGLLTSSKRGKQRRDQRRTRAGATAPTPLPPVRTEAGVDPTQQEGSRLERVMREFQRALEEAEQQRQPAPDTKPSWDAGEEWEVEEAESRSLEDFEPEVRSMEDDFHRPEREVVVLGGDQEALQARRVAYAEDRNRALTKADHLKFDARIRAPVPSVEPATPPDARQLRLRQAMIWREVLGPPVAMQDRDRR
ncbi:MAG: hypothetical protein ABR551_02410 [Gemmatimonadales bacterium]